MATNGVVSKSETSSEYGSRTSAIQRSWTNDIILTSSSSREIPNHKPTAVDRYERYMIIGDFKISPDSEIAIDGNREYLVRITYNPSFTAGQLDYQGDGIYDDQRYVVDRTYVRIQKFVDSNTTDKLVLINEATSDDGIRGTGLFDSLVSIGVPQVLIEDGWWQNLFYTPNELKSIVEASALADNSLNLITKPSSYSLGSADIITNFDPNKDKLEIDSDSFEVNTSASFKIVRGRKALKKYATQDINFLYDQRGGGLYFNENGSGKGFGDGGIIAVLKGSPELLENNLGLV